AQDLHSTRGLAYTTISTTLDRLYKKGILARDEAVGRGGSRYVYRLHSEDKVKGRVVKGFVDRLLTAFGPSIISTLHDYMDEIPKEDLKRLEEKVRRESGQRRDYAGSKGGEQPVNESFHDSTFDLVLRVKAIHVSGSSSANSLISRQDPLLVKSIKRRADRSIGKSARGMKVLGNLAGRSVSKPDNCPEDSRLKISKLHVDL